MFIVKYCMVLKRKYTLEHFLRPCYDMHILRPSPPFYNSCTVRTVLYTTVGAHQGLRVSLGLAAERVQQQQRDH